MGGFHRFERSGKVVEDSSATRAMRTSNGTDNDENHLRRLYWPEVEALLDAGLVQLPRPSEIQDKSKSDWVSKSLLLIQITWFITQCIGRRTQHLPLTELEVITLAYTIVNVMIYAVWWEKPYRVAEPVRVYDKAKRAREDHAVGTRRSIFAMFIAGVVFGAVHFIAWASLFPTPLERLLWRIFTIVLTVVPIVAPIFFWLLHQYWIDRFGEVGVLILSFAYIVGRVITLVLAFTTLRRLPPEAYQNVEWSDLLPHI